MFKFKISIIFCWTLSFQGTLTLCTLLLEAYDDLPLILEQHWDMWTTLSYLKTPTQKKTHIHTLKPHPQHYKNHNHIIKVYHAFNAKFLFHLIVSTIWRLFKSLGEMLIKSYFSIFQMVNIVVAFNNIKYVSFHIPLEENCVFSTSVCN